MNCTEVSATARRVADSIETAIIGKRSAVELSLAVLLSEGHLLIEDIPGVGKTTLAKALARSLGLSFKRIQFTPDLLPSDITGSSIYNQKTGEFEIRCGPIFANVVLADEINRTTPKTQAALLESMEEHQVTIDGVPHGLESPFLVIATQNNIEMSGTYPLPEAQLDRFAARLRMGYPDRASELRILTQQQRVRPVDTIVPCTTADEIIAMQSYVREVHIDSAVQGYILDIVGATRAMPSVMLGASPRGSLDLMRTAQALAAIQGRTYVAPDDVKALAPSVLSHRIILKPEQRIRGVSGVTAIEEALGKIAVPVSVVA